MKDRIALAKMRLLAEGLRFLRGSTIALDIVACGGAATMWYLGVEKTFTEKHPCLHSWL